MGVCRPKVRRIALESAFEPSMMNNRGRVGSTPRSTKLSISAWTTEAFSVAPSISPRGCLIPSPSMPTAATRTRCSVMWMPSICTTKRSSPERSASIKLFMRSLDNATKCRDAADFDVPAPAGAGISPSGSRTARRNFRVETLMSIRFIAHRPSQSSVTACSQLGSTSSWPPSSRTRGRSTSILPPWKPIFPCVWPHRYPRRLSPRAWRGPQSSSASFSIIAESASMPAVKQNRSKLADTSSQALPTAPAFIRGKAVSVVLTLFMALLSFVESAPRAYRLKASNAAPSFSTFPGTFPLELVRGLKRADHPRGARVIEDAVSRGDLAGVALQLGARLRSLSSHALRLAQAIAILGDGCELRHAAALAQAQIGHAISLATELVRLDVLGEDRPARFVHPIVQHAVLQTLSSAEHDGAHRAAAGVLYAEGQPPGRIAAHVKRLRAVGDAWAVERLCEGAREALENGAPAA